MGENTPTYVCPMCGRTVRKPRGVYYCRVCGPEYVMREVPPKREKVAPFKPFEEMSDAELFLEAEKGVDNLTKLMDFVAELDIRFPEYDFGEVRWRLSECLHMLDWSLRELREKIKKPAS